MNSQAAAVSLCGREVIIALMATDLPEQAVLATGKWGILAKSKSAPIMVGREKSH